MSNASPTVFLMWAMLACLFLVYLIYHLWAYDKLRCVLWNSGRQPGAFKRVMTYSYLLTVPLLVVFSVGITFLKYREGFILQPLLLPNGSFQHDPALPAGVSIGTSFPKPIELWSPLHRHVLLGIYFAFSVAWALEQVTHFEELAFWLFLLDQKTEKRVWFESWEYRLWYTSCIGSILGMPLTTLVARKHLETTDAWTFLVGSSMSTFTNVCFLYVLLRFPAFLRHVKEEGASPDVVVRLSLFYELNLVRIVFRFAVCLSLLVLSIDGVQGTHPINRDIFWTDFLLMVAGLGQFASSAITLMIFFPRSVSKDAGYQHKVQSGTISSGSSIPSTYSVANSFYPPGVQSPKSPEYPSAVISPAVSSVAPPPFLLRGANSRGDSFGMNTPRTVLSSRMSVASTSDDGSHDNGEEVPSYEEGTQRDSYAMQPARRGSTSKGVEFDIPEDLAEDDGGYALPRLPRHETALVGTSRYRSHAHNGTWDRADKRGSASSALHPYVTSFTSPIDLAEEPRTTIPGRMV